MDFGAVRNDFEVRYRFLSADEGGRHGGSPSQGYRCDWMYADSTPIELKTRQVWMIWPIFLDSDCLPLPVGSQAGIEGIARMVIVDDELRETVHQKRIRVGTEGYFVEGFKHVAVAEVVRVVELAKI